MKIRRGLALLLTFLLVFSSSAMAAAGPVSLKDERTKPVTSQEKISKEDEQTYKSTDKVRVIVEVEGDPAITYATNQGKKFSDLNESKKVELHNAALNSQNKVKQQFTGKKVNIELKEDFTTVFNGFSGIVEYGEIEKIKKISGVTNVTISTEYERPEAEPEMKYSKELVEAQRAWDDYGYDGEGMIVGIIDTGVDPSHKDMILSDDEKAALSENEAKAAISENGLPGTFHTAKVPYGYNYMDENQEILDLGPGASMHGMHVAGTVGANGDEANGGIKGVSPEAQLLALKVFGNDPGMGSTWGDIYVKAIDDAIILGVDVLNLSLGSTASFVSPEDPEQKAIERAVENGVLMSISAGNSANFGNGFYNPYASNPDIGVVGSPGLSFDSLQVASLENSFMDMDAVNYSFDGQEGQAPFMSASSVHPDDLGVKTFGLEYAGLGGTPEDFAGKDFAGKFALIQRGTYDFVTKAKNAQAAGASGVIVYNNADGYVSMATEASIVIPQLFMLKSDGDLLAKQIQAGQQVTLEFAGEKVTSGNPLAGEMSGFTSWGVTPNLDFKPEITAPGGNILSTFQDDQYGTMSGTSMAAPHVSGGSAIVLQRVDQDFDLDGKARVEMAKNILMNTSRLVEDKGLYNNHYGLGNPYSPRRQGAGLMQLHAALSTPVVVTEVNSNLGKVALKEIGDKVTFTLKAENVSDKAVTYNVDGNVQTDFVIDQKFNELEAGGIFLDGTIEDDAPWLGEYPISFSSDKITIPANDSITFKVTIDLTEAVDWAYNAPIDTFFENGYFVEGFVKLTDPTDKYPELSVPYVGFKGDWNAAPVLDELAYDGNDSFYEQAAMVSDCGDTYCYLGYDPLTKKRSTSKIAISPNGDGSNDEIIPVLSFLRNAKLVEYNVLDADKNVLRKIKSENNIRKNYFDGGSGGAQQYRLNPTVAWDGNIKNKPAADGQYYYEIATTIDYPGKDAQKVQIPVIVDTVAPEVTASLEGNKVTFGATDELSGIAYAELLVNGDVVATSNGVEQEHTFSKKLPSGTTVSVVAEDYAGNTTEYVISGVNDKTPPVITPKTPGTGEVFNKNEVQVSGTVKDDSKVVEFKVNGQDVELVWDKEKGHYTYDTTVTFEKDGSHIISLHAKDEVGNKASLSNSRFVIIDTTAPGLKVDAPAVVSNDTTKVNLVAHLTDNFDEISYYVDGSEEFAQDQTGYDMVAFDKVVTTEVSLEIGKNEFELKIVDIAGNETIKNVVINRAKQTEPEVKTGWVPEDGKWYYYDSKGNKLTGWQKDGTTWYYLDKKSGVMQTDWLKDGTKWYYLAKSGAMQTDWVKVGTKWYYFDASGAMQTDWVKVGTKWYFFDASGAMQTDWVKVGTKWYFFDKNGAMQTDWVKVGTKWYFLDKNGAMQTGWLKDGTQWYYLNSNGEMQTGWVTISGEKYYFNSSGVWVG